MHSPNTPSFAVPPALLSLMRELGELKRVRSAGRHGSIATRLFLDSWSRLVGGTRVDEAMRYDAAAALAAARLGDLDRETLVASGMSPDRVRPILERGFEAVADGLDPALAERLRPGLDGPRPEREPPGFAHRLAAQPRAGATCPGQPRLVLEPPENHAEHCAIVAVAGVLLSPVFGADPVTVWLASLSHHLHNACIPDSGFAGEMLLDDALVPLMAMATGRALAELPDDLARAITQARRILDDAETPEGRAFHAADTLDRVWQIEQHLRPGRITMDLVLNDMALVHDGPVRPFQARILAAAGIGA